MPDTSRTFDNRHLTINKNSNFRQLSVVNCHRFLSGFTLIELLIVISLMGLAGSLVTTYYLTFERSQRLKSAALTLKSDIRYVQNNALSGNKGVTSAGGCAATSTLGGWYLELTTSDSTSYRLAGDCLIGASEADFNSRAVSLPSGIRISRLTYGVNRGEINILFRPLASDVAVFGSMGSPDFFDNSQAGVLNPPLPANDLIIELTGQGGATYQVIVKPSGEVNEQKT